MKLYYTAVICILTIIIIFICIKRKNVILNLRKNYSFLAIITATHTVFNVNVPSIKNILDMVTIHPTGIYLINIIQYEGQFSGTIGMDFWDIKTPENKKFKIKNPIKEMKENEDILKSMFYEPVFPVIIFKNKTRCDLFDGWMNNNLILIKEYEQEEIFKNKEYIISYTRAEDIFENLKQFQSHKKRVDR